MDVVICMPWGTAVVQDPAAMSMSKLGCRLCVNHIYCLRTVMLQPLAVLVAVVVCGSLALAAAAPTSPNSTSSYQQQQNQQALLLEDWTLVLRDGVDPVAFAAALCSAANPLRKLHVYECDERGVYSVLLRGMSGEKPGAGKP